MSATTVPAREAVRLRSIAAGWRYPSGVAMSKLYGVAQVIRRRQDIDAWFQIWNTMDLNALLDFALVAANQGLGKASRASGRSKATLSRRIAELEEQLGVRLVERSARGLRLTEAGQVLMERTEVPLSEVAEAMAAAREGLSTPRGRLRVASPVLFSQLAMGRIGAEFCAAYPEITLEVGIAHVQTIGGAEGARLRGLHLRQISGCIARAEGLGRLHLAAPASACRPADVAARRGGRHPKGAPPRFKRHHRSVRSTDRSGHASCAPDAWPAPARHTARPRETDTWS